MQVPYFPILQCFMMLTRQGSHGSILLKATFLEVEKWVHGIPMNGTGMATKGADQINEWGESAAACYRWTTWVWEITGWSSRFRDNYWSFWSISWNIPQFNEEKNWKMSTCNWLHLETLGSRPIMPNCPWTLDQIQVDILNWYFAKPKPTHNVKTISIYVPVWSIWSTYMYNGSTVWFQVQCWDLGKCILVQHWLLWLIRIENFACPLMSTWKETYLAHGFHWDGCFVNWVVDVQIPTMG